MARYGRGDWWSQRSMMADGGFERRRKERGNVEEPNAPVLTQVAA
jgi:hypothetical protein